MYSQDTTQKGYCLTEASNQSDVPVSDMRLLNSSAFHLERFVVNACMYFALGDQNENVETVRKIMYPQPDKKIDLKDFFWLHMKKDLSLLSKTLNLTLDEVIILLHKIVFSFLTKKADFKSENFSTKEERQMWEDLFNKVYLSPIFTNTSFYLNESNQLIQQQNLQEEKNQSKIYFMAYELLNEDPTKKNHFYEHEEFWRYRPIVTFGLMTTELNLTTNKEKHKVLKQFSKSIYLLQMLDNYSDIIKLINMLHLTLNKAIFKYNAQHKSIRDFISTNNLPKDWSKKQVEFSVKCFQNVWLYSKQHLNDHIQNTNISKNSSLVDFFSHDFNMDTKLSFFLPTLNGDGLYCYALVHYLSSIQNKLLDYYHEIKKVTVFETKNSELFENKDYLIISNKVADLSRIVQANFSYDSKNLKCIFKYDNIESQIIDKYLRTKPNIELNVT